MSPAELVEIGAEIVLGNTFHLMLRPGTDVIRAQFPALSRRDGAYPVAYFDGPGGTQVPQRVVSADTAIRPDGIAD